MLPFTWFDVCLALVVLWSTAMGLRAGLARVVVGTVAAIAGVIAGFWCYRLVGAHLLPWVHSPTLADVLGFLLIFCGALILGSLMAAIFSKLFRWVGLSWFDHLLGGVAGLLRGALVTAALLDFVVAFAPSPVPEAIQNSRVLPYISRLSSVLVNLAPRELRDAFSQQMLNLRQMWKEPGKKGLAANGGVRAMGLERNA